MAPRLRTLLVGFFASALAVWIGIAVAQEQHLIASLAAGLSAWAVLAWTTRPRAEAWLLAFLIFGYVIGSRGFAQYSPIPGLPLFSSELGLAFVFAMLALRGALERTLPIRKDWLNGLLVFFLAIGCARVGWDVRTHGLMAIRDFAMVYYLLYFFAAQALARHADSHTLLRHSLLVVFGVLPITGIIATTFPESWLSDIAVNGVPLIYYKGDLLATFLFTGFIILLPSGRFNYRTDALRWLLTVASLMAGLTTLSRSSLLGLLVASSWLAWAGRWRAIRTIMVVCVSGLLLVTVLSLLQKKDFTQTKAYAIYEATVSIADFSGTRHYQNEMSSDKGDNNRFRLVWWKNVAQETLTASPLFGLGFGADLARGFLTEYYPTTETDFSARSPHNIFMTTLGRMGLLGVGVLLAIYWVQARSTARVARAARSDPALDYAITLQAAVWVVMVSACLGVVLEGPMGAIPFWTMLGLAHHAATQIPTAPLPAGAARV